MREAGCWIYGREADWQQLVSHAEKKPGIHTANFMTWAGDRDAGRELVDRVICGHMASSNMADLLDAFSAGGWARGQRLLHLLATDFPPLIDSEAPAMAQAAGEYGLQLRLAEQVCHNGACSGAGRFTASGLLANTSCLLVAQAQCMIAHGDLEGGVQRAMSAVIVRPGNTWWLLGVREQLIKAGAEAQGNALVDEALAREQRVLDRHPDAVEVLGNYAWLAGRSGRDLLRAEAHARHAVALVPREAWYCQSLGAVLKQRGEMNLAMEAMRECVWLEPSFFYLHRLGWALEEQREKAAK